MFSIKKVLLKSFSPIYSSFKRYHNSENYKSVLFHYDQIHTSYLRLKQIQLNKNINNDSVRELNECKEELNRIKQYIEMNDINYTIIYLKLEDCKQKLNVLFRNI